MTTNENSLTTRVQALRDEGLRLLRKHKFDEGIVKYAEAKELQQILEAQEKELLVHAANLKKVQFVRSIGIGLLDRKEYDKAIEVFVLLHDLEIELGVKAN